METSSLLHMFNRFWDTWAKRERKERTIDDILPYFDRDITAYGTGDHEKGRSYDNVVQNFRDDFECNYRGRISVKGEVELDMYYVL